MNEVDEVYPIWFAAVDEPYQEMTEIKGRPCEGDEPKSKPEVR